MGFLYKIKMIPELYTIVTQFILLILLLIGIAFLLPNRGFFNKDFTDKYTPQIIKNINFNKLKNIKNQLIKKQFEFFIPIVNETCKSINQPIGDEGCNNQCNEIGFKYYDKELGGCFNDPELKTKLQFNPECYKNRYEDLKDITNEQATKHWNTIGKLLLRNGSCYDEYNNIFEYDESLKTN